MTLTIVNGERGAGVKYGWQMIATDYDSGFWAEVIVDEMALIGFLKKSAERQLPPNTRYQLRKAVPEFYGRSHMMAWYRNPEMDTAETWGCQPEKPKHVPEGGYLLIGEYVTPPAQVPGVSPQPNHAEV